ncbi:Uncharacterized protein HZ326_22983 [Fusarium oxysporum f. sp. albedinis]|nr:Uncharacterized protein HZ326_22983 [Fusarium oxysporum f. sp. albedinis]
MQDHSYSICAILVERSVLQTEFNKARLHGHRPKCKTKIDMPVGWKDYEDSSVKEALIYGQCQCCETYSRDVTACTKVVQNPSQ